MTYCTPIGWQIRILRERRGWRQADLADLAETQQNRVNDWENGKHTPTLPVLQRIAGAYGMSVSELLRGVM